MPSASFLVASYAPMSRLAAAMTNAEGVAPARLNGIALTVQFLGPLVGGLRRPPHHRHRVAPGKRVDQFIEGREQTGLLVDGGLVAAPRCLVVVRTARLLLRPRRWPGSRCRGSHPITPPPLSCHHDEKRCRRTGNDAALPFVQVGKHGLEESNPAPRRSPPQDQVVPCVLFDGGLYGR